MSCYVFFSTSILSHLSPSYSDDEKVEEEEEDPEHLQHLRSLLSLKTALGGYLRK